MTRFCCKRKSPNLRTNFNLVRRKFKLFHLLCIETLSNLVFSLPKIPLCQSLGRLVTPHGTRVALISWRILLIRIELNWQNTSGNWIDWWFHQTLLIMQQMMIELNTLNIGAPSILAKAIDKTCQNERHWSVNYQSFFFSLEKPSSCLLRKP